MPNHYGFFIELSNKNSDEHTDKQKRLRASPTISRIIPHPDS